jgi:flagellar protein FlaG
MSEPISAIGANAQAPPTATLARPPVQQQVSAAAEPKKAVVSVENAAVASGAAVGAAPEKIVAEAGQNGSAAQRGGENYSEAQAERQPFSKEETQKAAESFKEYVNNLPGEMKFTVDHDTNRQIFKIVNPVTQEVVKQFPPDEFLTMIKRLKEIGPQSKDNGIFLDEKS